MALVALLIGIAAGALQLFLSFSGSLRHLGRLANALLGGILTTVCMFGALPLVNELYPEGPLGDPKVVVLLLIGFAVFFAAASYVHFVFEKSPSHYTKSEKHPGSSSKPR